MRTATIEPINRERGNTYSIGIILKSDGDPVDITGYSAELIVLDSDGPDAGASTLFSVSGVIADALGGEFTFTPTLTDTDRAGAYWYGVKVTTASGKTVTPIKGPFILNQSV